jgi:histidine triad (HIT) family protein
LTRAAECVICKIVAGVAEASVVYEDDRVLAFLDIAPLTDGHTLVVPKEHYENVFDIPPDMLAHLTTVAQEVALRIRTELRVPSVNLINSSGSEAGQDVFHFHLHVVPRRTHAEIRISPNPKRGRPSREELDELAAKIRLNSGYRD